MLISKTKIKDVFVINWLPHKDKRGYFVRTYDRVIFSKLKLNIKWVQESQSFSKNKGIVRGLHFQFPPYSETKIVRAVMGKIYMVYLDLRKDSKTFGKWDNIILSEKNSTVLYLPRGLALGMCTLTNNCMLLYKMDNIHAPKHQGEIKWNDSQLGIKWPTKKPILSKRDQKAMSFAGFIKKYGGLSI